MQNNNDGSFIGNTVKLGFGLLSFKAKLYILAGGIVIFIIICCFGYILDLNSNNKNTSSEDTNNESLGLTTHENLIYKGGELPLPFTKDYYVITSKFNPTRKHPLTGVLRPHQGVDIVSYKNCEILAVADGTVTIASFDAGGYGNWVEIDHGNFKTRYGHMRDTPLVKKGDKITAGNVIGIQGSTGGSTGDHLHFEVRINGKATDPEPFLFGKN